MGAVCAAAEVLRAHAGNLAFWITPPCCLQGDDAFLFVFEIYAKLSFTAKSSALSRVKKCLLGNSIVELGKVKGS